ncbi:hypothetical protein WJX79_008720 [Trebouxia sp. C0005]
MFYGTSQYDPVYIIAQIASIQAIFYITLGALFWLLVGPYASGLTLSYLFSSVWLQVGGWMVERAKKCLDFSFTVHFIHIVASASYAGFPRRWEWWGVTGASFLITALLSEAICTRRELRDIPLGGTAHKRAPQAELTPLNTSGQAAGRSPASKGMAAINSVVGRAVNKSDAGRPSNSMGSKLANEQV